MSDEQFAQLLSQLTEIRGAIAGQKTPSWWADWDFWRVLLMLAALIVAAIAAWFSSRSAHAAETSVRTVSENQRRQLLLTMLNRYHEPDMSDSLRRVGTLPTLYSTPKAFIDKRRAAIASLADTVRDEISPEHRSVLLFDDARRRVKSYFLEIAEMLIARILDDETARLAAARYGVSLFFGVVQPIEHADGSREKAKYERLRALLVDKPTLLDQLGLDSKQLLSWDNATAFPLHLRGTEASHAS